jgi:hypothetical protein
LKGVSAAFDMNFDIKSGRTALREISILLLGEITSINSLPTAQKTYGFSITKIKLLISFLEIVAFHSGAHKIHKYVA